MARAAAGRIASGHERPFVAGIFGIFTPFLNRFIVHVAGGRFVPFWALLRHRGRRSGREYATPVTARRIRGGFAVPMAFGAGADWYRNVRASGVATIRWGGKEYALIEPQAIAPESAVFAFPGWQRALFRAIGIRTFVFLKDRES